MEFIEQVIQWPCYGDPTHTFSDAEREIQRRLRQIDLLGLYRKVSRAEREATERAEFAELKAKFEPTGMPLLPYRTANFASPPRDLPRAV